MTCLFRNDVTLPIICDLNKGILNHCKVFKYNYNAKSPAFVSRLLLCLSLNIFQLYFFLNFIPWDELSVSVQLQKFLLLSIVGRLPPYVLNWNLEGQVLKYCQKQLFIISINFITNNTKCRRRSGSFHFLYSFS